MRNPWTFLVAAALAAQALAVGLVSGGERLLPVPDLALFPTEVVDWTKVREDLIAEGVVKNLGADARVKTIGEGPASNLNIHESSPSFQPPGSECAKHHGLSTTVERGAPPAARGKSRDVLVG